MRLDYEARTYTLWLTAGRLTLGLTLRPKYWTWSVSRGGRFLPMCVDAGPIFVMVTR